MRSLIVFLISTLVCAVLAIGTIALPARAQERQFQVTLSEAQWNTVGKIVSKTTGWSWEETSPIMQSILAQISAGLQQDAQARQRTASEVEQLKAEVERLKSELAKHLPSPTPLPEAEEPK